MFRPIRNPVMWTFIHSYNHCISITLWQHSWTDSFKIFYILPVELHSEDGVDLLENVHHYERPFLNRFSQPLYQNTEFLTKFHTLLASSQPPFCRFQGNARKLRVILRNSVISVNYIRQITLLTDGRNLLVHGSTYQIKVRIKSAAVSAIAQWTQQC